MVLIKTLLRPQSTMEYLYLILERKTLLLYYCGMYRCLIIFIFWKFRDCFYLLASLAKAISGRAEIVEWKLDTDMMMCKKSSNAHLFSHNIIDFRGKQCTVFSPSHMHDVIWQLRNRSVYFVVV